MRLLRRLKFLMPFYRRRVEQDVDEELASIAEIAARLRHGCHRFTYQRCVLHRPGHSSNHGDRF